MNSNAGVSRDKAEQPAYPENSCASVSKYTSVFMYTFAHCVFTHVASLRILRYHVQWTCSTRSTHSVKLQMHPTFHIEYEFVSIKIRVWLFYTLHFQFICVWLFYTLHFYTSNPFVFGCFTPYTSCPTVSLHIKLQIRLCITHHLNPIVSSRAQPIFTQTIRTCPYAEVRLTRLFQTIQPLLRKRSAQEATYLIIIVSFV